MSLALILAACGGNEEPAQQASAQAKSAVEESAVEEKAGGQAAATAKKPATDEKPGWDGFEMLYADWAAAEAAWLQEAAPVIDQEVQGRNSMAEDALIVFTVLHARPGDDAAVVAEEEFLTLVDHLENAEGISDPDGARDLYTKFQEVEATYKGTDSAIFKAIQAETGAALVRAGFADRGMTVARATSTPFVANVIEALLETGGLEAAQRFGQYGFVYPNYQFSVLSVADAYAAAGHTDTAVNALLDIRQGPYANNVSRIKQLAGERFDTAVARSLAQRKKWEKKLEYERQRAQRAGTPMTPEEYLAQNPGPSFFGMQKAQPTEWFHTVAQAGAHPPAVETAIRHYRDNIELRLAALAGLYGVPLAW